MPVKETFPAVWAFKTIGFSAVPLAFGLKLIFMSEYFPSFQTMTSPAFTFAKAVLYSVISLTRNSSDVLIDQADTLIFIIDSIQVNTSNVVSSPPGGGGGGGGGGFVPPPLLDEKIPVKGNSKISDFNKNT